MDTPGGRYYAEVDDEAPVTREGQLIFFAQFLHVGGRWERFLKSTPLRYEGNRGSRVVDVLGTAALSILCGHWRYAHINAVRGDTLNARGRARAPTPRTSMTNSKTSGAGTASPRKDSPPAD